MTKGKKRPTMTDILKQAIRDCGLTGNRLAIESRVAQPIIHRFMAGDRDIKLGTADKLAIYFKLRLTK
jgi:plasmid maintenance system antidote protein VapI